VTAATYPEDKSMGREGMLLNVICVLAALVFVALAIMNFLAEGSFFSTDSLFITLVWLMLAMLFLAVPALDMFSRGVMRFPFGPAGKTTGDPVSRRASVAATTDAKGRPMPPDVRRMMSDMKGGQKE